MGDLSDTPRLHLQPRAKNALAKTAIAGTALLLSALSWGVALPVGRIGPLEVRIEFAQLQTFDKTTDRVVYPTATNLTYRIKIVNQGETSVSNVELQSWIAANTASCQGESEPLHNAPGAAFSPVQSMAALAPGESRTFEVTYAPGACSFDGDVKISLHYVDDMRKFISALLVSPTRLRIQ